MTKNIFHRILLAVTLALALPAHADEYPSKPIKMIVPYPAGGTTDALARIFAKNLQAKWGQTVIVENRGGAAGNIGAEAVWRSAPDGYTLLFAAPGPLVINKSLYPKLVYDPDMFVPVSLVAATPNVLIINPKQGMKNVQELIAYAKVHPDRLNYASQGIGSTSHLAAELFKSMAGVKIVHVPYRGSSPAITDVLGGQTDMMFVELSSVLSHIRAGTVRVLAVGGEKHNPLLPNVPTISETLPGFASATWFGTVAPPKTSPEIANTISTAIAETLKQPDVAKLFLDLSLQAIGSTPAEMKQFMKPESERWGNLIRATGITGE